MNESARVWRIESARCVRALDFVVVGVCCSSRARVWHSLMFAGFALNNAATKCGRAGRRGGGCDRVGVSSGRWAPVVRWLKHAW